MTSQDMQQVGDYREQTIEVPIPVLIDKLRTFFTAQASEADLITLTGEGFPTVYVRGNGTVKVTATKRVKGPIGGN